MKTITFSLKRATVIAIALYFQTLLVAAPVLNYPTTIIQPDGQVIKCFVCGDEFYHWLHDENDFTIVKDESTGWYSYASISDGKLVPTNYMVGKEEPSKVGLMPRINPSAEFIQNLRNQRLSHLKHQPTNTTSTNTGTLNKIAVFVRFADEEEFEDSIAVYKRFFNDSSENAKSLYAYFKEASYSKLLVKTHFIPEPENDIVVSYQDSLPRGYYQARSGSNPGGYTNNFDSIIARQNILVLNVISFLKEKIPDSLNLDFNNDNDIDNISLLIIGKHDEEWNALLWESTYNFFEYSGIPFLINDKRVNWVDIEFQNYIVAKGCRIVAHETFHTLLCPDLYHYNGAYVKAPVGNCDIMGDYPEFQHMSAYTKYRYGKWIDSIPLIDETGTYSLKSLVSAENNCYRINSPYSTTEYFVLEYRKKQGSFESYFSNNGLLAYRVNTIADGQGNGFYPNPPDELYLFRQNGSPTAIGNIYVANLNETRNSINDTTKNKCFLANGDPGGLNISNIREEGDSIVFYVDMQPVGVLQTVEENNTLNLYPNPSHNYIQFTCPSSSSQSSQLQIFDYIGRQILAQTLSPCSMGETVTIDLSNQPAGIYLVRVKTGKEEFSGKVLLVN